MDRNFKVRVLVGVGMFVVSLLGICAFDAVPFKIMYAIFSLVAMIELFSFLTHGATAPRVALVILEAVFLICGAIFVARTSQQYFWYHLPFSLWFANTVTSANEYPLRRLTMA